MKSDSEKGKNREQVIAEVSRGIKEVSKVCDCPVIALAQLNRSVETRGGSKRPQLSDLRESGQIEQDADMVLFIHRPEYYGEMKDEAGNDTTGKAEIIIAKNRDGATGSINVGFFGDKTKFIDLDYSVQSIQPNTDFLTNPF
jgi:replicative DNA helicase